MASISFDVDSVKLRLINNLKKYNLWQDVLDTSAIDSLISPFAEEIQYLANFDTYLTRENKWSLAQNKTSLLSMTDIHRYQAHRKIGSTGILKISADETFNVVPSKNISIPKYTQFSSDDDTKFVSKNDYVLTTTDKYIEIDIIQGIPQSYTYIASGDDFEEFSIENENIENSFYELFVNGVKWTKLNNIYEADSTDTNYELTNIIDFSGIYIKFGNNINGKKLNNGDVILFRYINTEGFNGNISSSNSITTVDSTILDIDNSAVDIFVKNEDSLVGGLDFEEIEDIRKNAPEIYQTGDRASNNNDYRQIVLSEFSYVLKAIVWGTYENNIDEGNNPWTHVALDTNNVYLSTIRSDLSESLSTAQKLEISERLNNYKAPTDIVQFVDGVKIPIIFTVTAYISDKTYTITQVKNNIRTQLESTYALENREFFQHIRFSDYQREIDEVEGVDYHHTTLKFYDDNTFNNTFNVTLSIPIFPITPGSVEVYVKDTVNDTAEFLIATDDGSGNIIGETGYDIIGSTIDYSSGEGGISLDNDPAVLTEPYTNYRVRVFYSITASDLVLKERNHIFDYDDTLSSLNITAQYT